MSTRKQTNPKMNAQGIKDFVASLKDRNTALLIVDTALCKHSQRLMGEIDVTKSLSPRTSSHATVMHILNLGENKEALEACTWLPGVPCLLSNSTVHLGVDAFAKCLELCRSMDGVKIVPLRDI